MIPNSHFVADAAAGKLPPLVYVWHNSPEDEHPTADVTIGMNKVWESVDAVVRSGGWDDHVATPNVEHTPDGVQLAYGPRVPLIIFGGPVKPGIDSRWSNHAGIPKTVMQLLGLPKLGVDRVDNDPGLSDLIDPVLHNPAPPAYGSKVTLPAPPQPARNPKPLPAPPLAASSPVAPVERGSPGNNEALNDDRPLAGTGGLPAAAVRGGREVVDPCEFRLGVGGARLNRNALPELADQSCAHGPYFIQFRSHAGKDKARVRRLQG